MSAKPLNWAEAPLPETGQHPGGDPLAPDHATIVRAGGSNGAERISSPPRARRVVRREMLAWITRALDVTALTLVVLGLSAAAGLDLLQAPLSVAWPFLIMPLAAVAGVWIAGARQYRYAGSIAGHLFRTSVGAAGALAAAALAGSSIGRPWAAEIPGVAAACLAAIIVLHANYLGVIRVLTRAGVFSDNVVIVGATRAAARIIARNRRERELNILGYFDDRTARSDIRFNDAAHLGNPDDLIEWSGLPDVDRIIITVTSTAQPRVRDLIDRLRDVPQEIILVLDLEGFAPETTSMARVGDLPAAYVSGAPRDHRRALVKRMSDIVLASAMLVALVPVFAIVALLIRLDSPGPVFFRQKRHGFNNHIIRVWKFRTMRPDRLAEEGVVVQAVANDPRITRIGCFLRRTSLDELPQLLNVLAGEMSLVGPRPHAVGMTAGSTEVHDIVGGYAHRHRVLPGITGWAQINGSRGPVHTQEEVRERVRLDLEYIRRASFWFDLWILILTVPRLFGDRNRIR
ncbi:MAG: exopolysaccharide biosynthesis polyprenyl glycosylphosphotransferase [Hyphomonadaceae bacterium]